MLIQENLSIQEKLSILSDAAKYDVSCTSSGVERKGKKGGLGCASQEGICHSFTSDGRCVSLLKILLTNQCIYDCKYCINRCSNDTLRTAFTPEEVCSLTMEFYRRNYIEGLFLSSGILGSPDHTMELICQILWKLRRHHQFNGYIHVKAIPGADPSLIEAAGFLADRMSVNLELPTAEGLRRLAPGKTREKILKPMRQIQTGILRQIQAEGLALPWSLPEGEQGRYLSGEKESGRAWLFSSEGKHNSPVQRLGRSRYGNWGIRQDSGKKAYFVPGGQSTQMIVGATPETDFQMLSVAEALYQKFGMKRVFYSAYVPVNQDAGLPALPGGPPLLREHRLYQADWLLRYYGFQASDLLSEERPSFNVLLDPKCDWALRHLELFPVEINRADYSELLKVPGIGVKSAMRIVNSRRTSCLTFEHLKKIGVVLKRAKYFITCSGKMMYRIPVEEAFITRQLIGEDRRKSWELEHPDACRQLSLFDDFHIERNG